LQVKRKEELKVPNPPGTPVQQPRSNAPVVLQPLRVLLEVNDQAEVVSSGQSLVPIDVTHLFGATLDPELTDMFPLIGSSLDEHSLGHHSVPLGGKAWGQALPRRDEGVDKGVAH
jgi:hypothetical protein